MADLSTNFSNYKGTSDTPSTTASSVAPQQTSIKGIFDAYKASNPTVTKPGASSGSDFYSQMKSGAYSLVQPTQTPEPSFKERVQTDIATRGKQTMDALGNDKLDPFVQGFSAGGATLSLIPDVAGEAIKSIPGASGAMDAFSKYTPGGAIIKGITDGIGKIVNSPEYQSLQQSHPNIYAILNALGQAVNTAGTLTAAGDLATEAPGLVKQGANLAKKGVGLVSDAASSAKTVIGDTAKNLMGKTVLKTPEEILATPRELAGKLTPTQYTAWEQNQNKLLADSQKAEQTALDMKQQSEQGLSAQQKQSQQDLLKQSHQQQTASLQQEHQANLDNIAKTSQAKTDQLLAEGDALKKSFTDNSRATAISAREPIKNWIKDSGQHYRDLVEEQLAPKAKANVSTTDVSAEVDKAFGKDPVMAAKVKSALGLTEEVDPLSGKPTTLRANTTIGDLYEQAKGLRQGIGTAAKGGSRVLNADEMVTQNAVRVVSRVLENNGVDLSAANKFWSEYAPARNLAVSKFQPFDTGEFKANAGATTLQAAAQGTNADLANLVKRIEESTGEPLTADLKATLEKMTTNQRQLAIEKINAEEARATAMEAKKQGSEGLKTQQTYEQDSLAQKHAAEQSALEQKHAAEQQQLEGKKSGEQKQLSNDNLATKTQIERKAMIKNIIKGVIKGGLMYEGIKHF